MPRVRDNSSGEGERSVCRLIGQKLSHESMSFLPAVHAAILIAGCCHHSDVFERYGFHSGDPNAEWLFPYVPGKRSSTLQPPTLLSPPDRSVFGHYPRELVYRWKPAPSTPAGAKYLIQCDDTSYGNDATFGDWSRQQDSADTNRTGKTSFHDWFAGAQPGRWRVKAVDETGESEWSEWRYFRFTR